MSERLSLDELALQTGTDKSSQAHNYTRIYDRYFCSLRDKPIRFLEIGFLHGKSAKMWENYFEKASLYFLDINPSAFQYMKALSLQRSQLHIVDQANVEQLLNFCTSVGGNFDIIVDDGGHTMKQQIVSFQTLFPQVKSGGMYVIEDLHTSYPFGPNHNSLYGCDESHPQTTINFLKSIVDDVNKVSATTGYGDFKRCPIELIPELTMYEREIESIHFYASVCIVLKR